MAGLMPRARLLFLCQTLPYPPDGGVWIRTYHVLCALARAFDVTALCFERATASGSATVAAARAGLAGIAHVDVFPLPQRHSAARFAWDHARSVARGRVYTAFLYESRAFRDRLAAHVSSGRFDLVHMDSLDLAAYLPACGHLPVACVHHDIESELLARRAALEPDWARRAYLSYQSRRMRAVEAEWGPRLALNVTVSDADRDRLVRIAPGARVLVAPNGVDLRAFRPDPGDGGGDGVAYVGGASPAPNRDALEFFCQDVLTPLRALRPDVRVRWIGRASPADQERYRRDHGVELTGYVADERPLMRDAACHIVPLRIGGGTRLKILHAWALGKAVVSTSIGCEGLAVKDGENILIRDAPGDFAAAVAGLLASRAEQTRLGRAGRATVERLYDWRLIGDHVIARYRRLAAHGASAAAPPIAS